MDRVRKLLNVDFLQSKGYLGKNSVTAVLDTGIYPHQDIEGKIIDFADFVNHRKHPYDDNGHGTHVAGIIAGSGKCSKGRYKGIAPESKIIALKCLDESGNGSIKDAVNAIEYVIANKNRYGIRIVNISIGSVLKQGSRGNSVMIDAVERLWKEGLVVVAAAGNNGPERGTITVPGCARSIITVGSYDFEGSLNKKSGKIYNYSGRGPTSSCIIKPEILCPGKNIVSLKSNSSGYIAKSGTSMSAPVCTGILSLFVAENSYISNKELKKILYQTSTDLSLDKHYQVWGLINPYEIMISTKKLKN